MPVSADKEGVIESLRLPKLLGSMPRRGRFFQMTGFQVFRISSVRQSTEQLLKDLLFWFLCDLCVLKKTTRQDYKISKSKAFLNAETGETQRTSTPDSGSRDLLSIMRFESSENWEASRLVVPHKLPSQFLL